MASLDDYFDSLGKKVQQQPNTEVDRASMLLREFGSKSPDPERYRMAQSLEDSLADDAASMNRIDELRNLGALGFIQKYGLGSRAKQLLGLRKDDLDIMMGSDVSNEFDSELERNAKRRMPSE